LCVFCCNVVDARASRGNTRERGHQRRGTRAPAAPQGPPQIQLLALPQLDSIQRTLKILDVRLQHVQNNVNNDNKERQDIDHIRRLMSENQLALTSLVTTLGAIQEEVRTVRVLFNKHQENTFKIAPPTAVSIVRPPKQQQQQQLGAAQKSQAPAADSSASKDVKSPQTKPKPKPFVRMNSRV